MRCERGTKCPTLKRKCFYSTGRKQEREGHVTTDKWCKNCMKGTREEFELCSEEQSGLRVTPCLYLRSSLALRSALVSFQASSSGLLRAVGFMWSSTAMSLPCFQSS